MTTLQAKEPFEIYVQPTSLKMAPGTDDSNLTDPPKLTITNRKILSDVFKIQFSCKDNRAVKDWFKPIDRLDVDGGQIQDAAIHVTVPGDKAQALAGTYEVEIRVTNDDSTLVSETVRLIIPRQGSDYSVFVERGVLSDGTPSASYALSVTNNANAPLNVNFDDAPATEPYTFSASPRQSEVKPNQTQSFTVAVTPRGGQSLRPGQPIQVVTVGTYQLVGGASEPPIPHKQQLLWPRPPLAISTEPTSCSLVPDQEATIALTVANHGPNTAQVALSVEVLPTGWMGRIVPPQVNPSPGSSVAASLVITAPKNVASAGPYRPVLVRAASQNHATAEARVAITVEIVGGSTIELSPNPYEVHDGSQAHFHVKIQNNYNANLRVRLSEVEPTNHLRFALNPPPQTIAPAQIDQTAVLAVQPREPVTESRTDHFTVKMQQVLVLNDGTERPADEKSVPAELKWAPRPHPVTLAIDACDENGKPYVNSLGSEMTIKFVASGQWTAIPVTDPTQGLPKGRVDADGYHHYNQSNCLCPCFNLGALIVRTQDGQCIARGKQGVIRLQPRQTVFFVMNDVKGGYSDNDGQLIVTIQTE